jgi:hypothetical protein
MCLIGFVGDAEGPAMALQRNVPRCKDCVRYLRGFCRVCKPLGMGHRDPELTSLARLHCSAAIAERPGWVQMRVQ